MPGLVARPIHVSEILISILEKAKTGLGLTPDEAERFLSGASEAHWGALAETATRLTGSQFQGRLYFYAPLYFSSSCVNDCRYCGFRRSNTAMKRQRLTSVEFLREAEYLWDQGHRSLLLVAGEHPVMAQEDRLIALASELQRSGFEFSVCAEVGPLTAAGYRSLARAGISRCVLYQETYDRAVYAQVHEGPKKDFDWRFGAMGRALEAGIRHVGLGVLLGLSDWREDVIALFRHAAKLKQDFDVFPSTLSFPRLRPAGGDFSPGGWNPVDDRDFLKIISLARAALPTVGLNLTTRESSEFRDEILRHGWGVTHVSAGVSTSPGGYTLNGDEACGQFVISDERTLNEMKRNVEAMGYHASLSWDEPGPDRIGLTSEGVA